MDDIETVFLPSLMKNRCKQRTITFRVWGVTTFAWGMGTLSLTTLGECFPDDWGGGGDDSGLLDGQA